MVQLVQEETALKIQTAKVAHENPFAREMETNEQEFAEFHADSVAALAFRCPVSW